MMRRLLVIPIFFGSSLSVVFGQGMIKGKVFDSQTLEPLNGVYVILEGNKGTLSDQDGRYLIKTNTGSQKITYQFIGYSPITKSIEVNSGDTITMDVGLQLQIKEIGQIVVSANKNEQKVAELTVSMNVLKSVDFLKTHITDSRELINKTPGIEVLDGQASIRGGTGFSYGVGSRVMALIDGLPVLSPDAGNIKWQFLPLENISQIEIIKGASSVLYGSSALNGIINFRTAAASKIPETNFYAETGVYGKPQNLNWVWWNSPRIFSNLSFSHLRKAGNNDVGIGINLLDNNGYRKFNDEKLGRLSIRLKHYNQKVKGLAYGLNINSGYTKKTDFVLWEDADSGALKQDTSTVSFLHGSFLALDPYITYNNNGHFRHDIRIRYQSANNRFPVRTGNNSDAISLYAEYQVNYNFARILNVTAGLIENYISITSKFYGDHNGMNLAAFSQVEANPARKLKLVAGVRVENNSLDGLNDRVVPIFRAGINWQAAEYTFLRGSFGQGYRYPSIAEKFAATTLGTVRVIPNPDVSPESGWSSEIGIKQGVKAGKTAGQADLSVFLSQNKDMIEFMLTNYPYFGFMSTNIEQSRIYGYEFEFMLERPSGNFNTTFGGGYTYIHPAEINPVTGKETDTYLKYRRKHSVKISTTTSWKKLEAGLNLYGKSKILNIDNVFLHELTRETILPGFYDYWLNDNKAYWLLDGNIEYGITKALTLSVAVKNITNTEYIGRPGDIQPQRNYSVRIAGKF